MTHIVYAYILNNTERRKKNLKIKKSKKIFIQEKQSIVFNLVDHISKQFLLQTSPPSYYIFEIQHSKLFFKNESFYTVQPIDQFFEILNLSFASFVQKISPK
ncbi:hypothetical protein BpHYR1_032405 [Brachionus plicatilis]|uniref:Uncharacterized protein n=1 Tax=Brachionus plicatilis TaxID=10195 RepID=A0A3M7RZC7_BRAPC|nr:hypothetical protein BpHYR1_032405 [Brachionus plicatilis]